MKKRELKNKAKKQKNPNSDKQKNLQQYNKKKAQRSFSFKYSTWHVWQRWISTTAQVWHIFINTVIVSSASGDGVLKTVVENTLGQGRRKLQKCPVFGVGFFWCDIFFSLSNYSSWQD